MTVIAGGVIPSRSRTDTIVSSVPVATCISGHVARSTSATGVSGSIPASSKTSVYSGSFPTPMSTTSVPPVAASASQSTADSAFVGSSWPVTNETDETCSRWVTGIPAAPAPATAEVMPGTTSKGMALAARCCISSPPRPKTKGSPPFSRTTVLPALASSTSRRLVYSWEVHSPSARLPTSSRFSAGISSRIAGPGSLSWSTTSLRSSSRLAFTVSNSGSPGPLPTR